MTDPKTKLPKTYLLSVLDRKASERNDVALQFLDTVATLRARVSTESRFVVGLFPEYTPHDDEFHLSRLFHVADTLLGAPAIDRMNSSELLVLALALYGHDWGMAVSDAERAFIVEGKLGAGIRAEDLAILPGEHDRYRAYVQRVRPGSASALPVELWRNYVRETHAFRSAERVRRHFESVDPGLGDAVARVCLSHWLPAEDLRDRTAFPTDLSVLREPANMGALAVYLRLIDLFDIGDDRAPYVWWKFAAPQDQCSALEWSKHRAVRPITCPDYMDGRIVRVDGGTNDSDVFAGLEDLRNYCEEQLRDGLDVLSDRRDPRHKLDLFRVDWRVAALGFDPHSVRFEFDRRSVLSILTEEIYQGDAYVFLRELLQNSVDAIRMRAEVLGRANAVLGPTAIRVRVSAGPDDALVIDWLDEGVGMDEAIVRTYLAVAGRSYYHSDEFAGRRLLMDPISRFGIGILSCFMVADRVQIETFRDPYITPDAVPLRILIPDVEKQFRISETDARSVGTRVLVTVSKARLGLLGESSPLRITEYLSKVAAFVDIPVIVEEAGVSTMVVSPAVDARRFGTLVAPGMVVNQMPLSFGWDDAFLAQDVSRARVLLREHSVSFGSDLMLSGYEGALSYVAPADEASLVAVHSDRVAVRTADSKDHQELRFGERWGRHYLNHGPRSGLARSARRDAAIGVFRDGILLSEAALRDGRLPTGAAINVNIRKDRSDRLDLARTHVRTQEPWFKAIQEALDGYFVAQIRERYLSLPSNEAYIRANQALQFLPVSEEAVVRDLGPEWPIAFLADGGAIAVERWGQHSQSTIGVVGSEFSAAFEHILTADLWGDGGRPYDGALRLWDGGKALISPIETTYQGGFFNKVTVIQKQLLRASHSLTSVSFVRLGGRGSRLVLECWVPEPASAPRTDLLKVAVDAPETLEPREMAIFARPYGGEYFVRFPDDAASSCAFSAQGGPTFLNASHSLTHLYCRLTAMLRLSKARARMPSAELGEIADGLDNFMRALRYGSTSGQAHHYLTRIGGRYGMVNDVITQATRSRALVLTA